MFRKRLLRGLFNLTKNLNMSLFELAILRPGNGECAGKHIANVSAIEFLLEVFVAPVLEFCLVLNIPFCYSVKEDLEQFALIFFRHRSKMDSEMDARLDSDIDGLDT